MAAVGLLARLHGDCLRSLCTVEHAQGLSIAARRARHRGLPSHLVRKFTVIDSAFSLVRHLTEASIAGFIRDFDAAVEVLADTSVNEDIQIAYPGAPACAAPASVPRPGVRPRLDPSADPPRRLERARPGQAHKFDAQIHVPGIPLEIPKAKKDRNAVGDKMAEQPHSLKSGDMAQCSPVALPTDKPHSLKSNDMAHCTAARGSRAAGPGSKLKRKMDKEIEGEKMDELHPPESNDEAQCGFHPVPLITG